jgi:hypothetical protein
VISVSEEWRRDAYSTLENLRTEQPDRRTLRPGSGFDYTEADSSRFGQHCIGLLVADGSISL